MSDTGTRCPNCGDEDHEIVECPTCLKEKRTCCEIAGKNVDCFECEENEAEDE